MLPTLAVFVPTVAFGVRRQSTEAQQLAEGAGIWVERLSNIQ
jgi:hypothetical protein